jgi:hypothetical protein
VAQGEWTPWVQASVSQKKKKKKVTTC